MKNNYASIRFFLVIFQKTKKYLQTLALYSVSSENINQFFLLMMWVWYLDQEGYFSRNKWMIKQCSSSNSKWNQFLSQKCPTGMRYCTILNHIFGSIFFSHESESDWLKMFHFQPLYHLNIQKTDWGGFIQDAFGDNGYYNENFNDKEIKFSSLRALTTTLPDNLPLVNCFQLYEENIGKITEFTIGSLYEHLMSEKTRSSTGAFYTPQNVTQFLAKKALFHQLAFHQIFRNSIEKDQFRFNLSHSVTQLLKNEYNFLTIKEQENWLISLYCVITSLRIVDPAMGSGHFLIGAIEELEEIYEFWWKLAKNQSSDRISKFLLSKSKFQSYFTDFPSLKRFKLIVSSNTILSQQIYGVDINPEAIVIAKLRCFMALISSPMDKSFKVEHPIPLTLNIRKGNSLIGMISLVELQNQFEKNESIKIKPSSTNYIHRILKQIIHTGIEFYQIGLDSQYNADEFFKLYPKLHHLSLNPSSIPDIEELSLFFDLMNEIINLNLNSRNMILNNLGTQQNHSLEKYYHEIYQDTKDLLSFLHNLSSKTKITNENQNMFHWLIEFPEIFLPSSIQISSMKKTNNLFQKSAILPKFTSGFHIILGNPPYGNLLSHGEKPIVSQYASFSKEISSVFIERAINLNRDMGVLNFITSYVICFSKDLSKTREKLVSTYKTTLIASFDRDKCRFFEGMTQSISLLQCLFKQSCRQDAIDKTNSFSPIYTTSMYRKMPSLDHLSYLKANAFLLGKISPTSFDQKHRLPKCGNPVIQTMLSLFQSYSLNQNSDIKQQYAVLGDILSSPIILRAPVDLRQKLDPVKIDKGNVIWYRISGNYWYNAWDRIPYFGTQIAASHIIVSAPYLRSFLLIVFNSSIFYTWYRIYSDGRHMNTDIWKAFPLPVNLDEKLLLYGKVIDELAKYLMKKLFLHFDSSHNRFNSSEIKQILDICDIILGLIYQAPQKLITTILSWEPTIRGGIKLSSQDQEYFLALFSNKESFPLSSDQFAKFKERLERN